MNKKKIYIIGIGGIGISAIARYYLAKGYEVFGSDKSKSNLTDTLKKEGINITIGESPNNITRDFKLVIYTEAVPKTQSEILRTKELGIKLLTYPQALANIANTKKLITIAGTHGKSTTTSLSSLILKNSNINFTSIVGTLLKEFDNKNFFHRKTNNTPEYFIIEACEYNRSFLNYKPNLGIITNIELDHLDYYKDLEDYLNAFKEYLDNIVTGGCAIINSEDKNCKKLIGLRKDITYIEVYNNYYTYNGQKFPYPIIDIKIPGDHILFDAKIAYIIGHILGINNEKILKSLNNYSGVWRRMELIGKTVYNNILISDYGHHPTEIRLTLKSIKDSIVDKRLLVIFQPHQYSRTHELLEEFKNCFKDADEIIIPNIYESRDSEDNKNKINTESFVKSINHKNIINGRGFENTLKLIEKFDKNNSEATIVLMGAGDIDNLRNKINTV